MFTRCGELDRVAVSQPMSLAELKVEPAHWSNLIEEMRRLYQMERETVVRRRDDIVRLIEGLRALQGVLGDVDEPPGVAAAPPCEGGGPRCKCPRCKWPRVKANLRRLCEHAPSLLEPCPDVATCVDCGGVLPPTVETAGTNAPMCPPCARFRQVLGPPPRDPEGSVPAKLEDVRKKHAADVKEKNFQALMLHASSCVHHDEGDKSARDCQKMKVCDARGRGWPLAFFLTRTPFHFRFRVCLNTVLLGVRSSRAPAGSVLWWCRCWSGTHASVH